LDAKEVEGGGMRRSPGFASEDLKSEAPAAFPEFSSGHGQFPRLQLRDSAGFSPASLPSPSGEDARSYGLEKDRKRLQEKI
jgi:hypothetical protein